uniref:5' nucleotidase n=1 Tax=viral metagenome TaxID=1070528 RepID=A0A6H1ZPD8_9ZZZZ
MIIGSDLDGCIFRTWEAMAKYAKDFGYNVEYSDIYSYNSFLPEEIIQEAVKYALSRQYLPTMPGTEVIVDWLSVISDELHFITHRPLDVIGHTITQLDPIIPYTKYKLHLVTDKFNKVAVINRHNIDYMIEDHPETIEQIYENTDCICLVYSHPWNRNVEEKDRVIRVKNWIEIREFFGVIKERSMI